ncbi:transglycosylase SLT domain-containing protein [Leptolyngbya sp. CCNP1308]|uniref:lytic transglycosylase domain-containing protein n=1 Tax=Leptolyngbya sp. CCNP1308 TaxID=3110255 RepID=UPI002B219E36|nr:transglycosylase SLT domain-containing protein [Leptolyngbya sp. CCNP1308]MEA5452696.1 transglycosylase SLT domain-containing protein [Leptolyngbya sp. CCNP1308]
MVKWLKARLPLMAIAGLSALSLGMAAALVNTVSSTGDTSVILEESLLPGLGRPYGLDADDPVLAVALQPAAQRQEALQVATDGKDTLSQSRARYLLALDLINQNQGGSAIPLLEGLETEYPAMAPYVALALAQAQRAAGQPEAALQTQQRLLKEYEQNGAIAPLLFELGQQDPAYWDRLVQQFPNHPKAVEVAHQRLTADPNRADTLPLLMIMARAGLHHPSAGAALLRLKTEFASQLSPEDWQTVGFGFWRIDSYGDAAVAYAQAPPSPRNLYRAARGSQVSGKRDRAIALYSQLDRQFPDAPETATGLLRLAQSVPDEAALGVLDQVVNRFPDRAGEALLARAETLDKLNSTESAQGTRELILKEYKDSDAAADIRLKNALYAADQGDLNMALSWGSDVLKYSPDSDLAADAGYWVGKWGRQLGQADVAQKALESVIARHPESYYAWRAAVALGWNVGDFQSLRSQTPAVAPPAQRTPLPTGSATLQELYLLGQDQRAWEQWQMEYTNYQDPTPEEQFVDGLMRLGTNDNINGIYQVSSLSLADDPADLEVVHDLKQRPDFWHGVYPLPYKDLITTWSAQRQLNPLLVTALMRQESRFEAKIRSGVGAAGLMQVMPATADWIKGRAGLETYDLNNPEDNVKLGTWYLDYTHSEYDNHSLFAVASYNAGPGAVAGWIKKGGFVDADDFAEKIPYPETKGYVQSVFGGYWNYLRLYDPAIAEQVETLQKRDRGFGG